MGSFFPLDVKIPKPSPPISRKTRINQRKHKVARKRGMGGIGILGQKGVNLKQLPLDASNFHQLLPLKEPARWVLNQK